MNVQSRTRCRAEQTSRQVGAATELLSPTSLRPTLATRRVSTASAVLATPSPSWQRAGQPKARPSTEQFLQLKEPNDQDMGLRVHIPHELQSSIVTSTMPLSPAAPCSSERLLTTGGNHEPKAPHHTPPSSHFPSNGSRRDSGHRTGSGRAQQAAQQRQPMHPGHAFVGPPDVVGDLLGNTEKSLGSKEACVSSLAALAGTFAGSAPPYLHSHPSWTALLRALLNHCCVDSSSSSSTSSNNNDARLGSGASNSQGSGHEAIGVAYHNGHAAAAAVSAPSESAHSPHSFSLLQLLQISRSFLRMRLREPRPVPGAAGRGPARLGSAAGLPGPAAAKPRHLQESTPPPLSVSEVLAAMADAAARCVETLDVEGPARGPAVASSEAAAAVAAGPTTEAARGGHSAAHTSGQVTTALATAANLLHNLVKLGYSGSRGGGGSSGSASGGGGGLLRLTAALASAGLRHGLPESLDRQALQDVVWAIGKLDPEIHDVPVVRQLLAALAARLTEPALLAGMAPVGLSMLVYGFGKVGVPYSDAAVWRAVTDAVAAAAPRCQPQALANIAWGLSRTRPGQLRRGGATPLPPPPSPPPAFPLSSPLSSPSALLVPSVTPTPSAYTPVPSAPPANYPPAVAQAVKAPAAALAASTLAPASAAEAVMIPAAQAPAAAARDMTSPRGSLTAARAHGRHNVSLAAPPPRPALPAAVLANPTTTITGAPAPAPASASDQPVEARIGDGYATDGQLPVAAEQDALVALAEAAERQLDAFKPREAANLLGALAALGALTDPRVAPLLACSRRYVRRRLAEMDAQDVAEVLYAYGVAAAAADAAAAEAEALGIAARQAAARAAAAAPLPPAPPSGAMGSESPSGSGTGLLHGWGPQPGPAIREALAPQPQRPSLTRRPLPPYGPATVLTAGPSPSPAPPSALVPPAAVLRQLQAAAAAATATADAAAAAATAAAQAAACELELWSLLEQRCLQLLPACPAYQLATVLWGFAHSPHRPTQLLTQVGSALSVLSGQQPLSSSPGRQQLGSGRDPAAEAEDTSGGGAVPVGMERRQQGHGNGHGHGQPGLGGLRWAEQRQWQRGQGVAGQQQQPAGVLEWQLRLGCEMLSAGAVPAGQLARLVWALGRLGAEVAPAGLRHVSSVLLRRLDELDAQSLLMVSWGLAALRCPADAAPEPLAGRLATLLPTLTPDQLVMALWAAARLTTTTTGSGSDALPGMAWLRLLQASRGPLMAALPRLRPRSLAMAAWSYATAGVNPGEALLAAVWERAAAAAAAPGTDAAALAMVASAMAEFRCRHEGLRQAVLVAAAAQMARAAAAAAAAAAGSPEPFAAASDGRDGVGGGGGELQRDGLRTARSVGGGASSGHGGGYGGGGGGVNAVWLSSLVCSLGRMGLRHGRVLDLACHHVRRLDPELTARQAVPLLWGLGAMCRPNRAAVAAAVAAAAAKAAAVAKVAERRRRQRNRWRWRWYELRRAARRGLPPPEAAERPSRRPPRPPNQPPHIPPLLAEADSWATCPPDVVAALFNVVQKAILQDTAEVLAARVGGAGGRQPQRRRQLFSPSQLDGGLLAMFLISCISHRHRPPPAVMEAACLLLRPHLRSLASHTLCELAWALAVLRPPTEPTPPNEPTPLPPLPLGLKALIAATPMPTPEAAAVEEDVPATEAALGLIAMLPVPHLEKGPALTARPQPPPLSAGSREGVNQGPLSASPTVAEALDGARAESQSPLQSRREAAAVREAATWQILEGEVARLSAQAAVKKQRRRARRAAAATAAAAPPQPVQESKRRKVAAAAAEPSRLLEAAAAPPPAGWRLRVRPAGRVVSLPQLRELRRRPSAAAAGAAAAAAMDSVALAAEAAAARLRDGSRPPGPNGGRCLEPVTEVKADPQRRGSRALTGLVRASAADTGEAQAAAGVAAPPGGSSQAGSPRRGRGGLKLEATAGAATAVSAAATAVSVAATAAAAGAASPLAAPAVANLPTPLASRVAPIYPPAAGLPQRHAASQLLLRRLLPLLRWRLCVERSEVLTLESLVKVTWAMCVSRMYAPMLFRYCAARALCSTTTPLADRPELLRMLVEARAMIARERPSVWGRLGLGPRWRHRVRRGAKWRLSPAELLAAAASPDMVRQLLLCQASVAAAAAAAKVRLGWRTTFEGERHAVLRLDPRLTCALVFIPPWQTVAEDAAGPAALPPAARAAGGVPPPSGVAGAVRWQLSAAGGVVVGSQPPPPPLGGAAVTVRLLRLRGWLVAGVDVRRWLQLDEGERLRQLVELSQRVREAARARAAPSPVVAVRRRDVKQRRAEEQPHGSSGSAGGGGAGAARRQQPQPQQRREGGSRREVGARG